VPWNGPRFGGLFHESSDIVQDPRSSLFDAGSCIELNNNFFKLVSW
jgi:glyceraldehyde-3-phosphate dehydrogenase/erythrose-4-phosphate dehydrogenase